nr:penicillin-insensitive murein endopeptidase [Deltaproteobacteria bacterium]
PVTMQRSVRVIVGASLGAAVLSTAVAIYTVTRPPVAVAVPDEATPTTAAAQNSVVVTPPPQLPVVATASPPVPAAQPVSPWPDLVLDGLPAEGTAPESMGQSVGSPRDGALLRPAALTPGRGYLIRNENTVFATSNTIGFLAKAIRHVRRRHRGLHRVVIGDMSTRRGGPLPGHQSHQSGRDVDLGFYYRDRFTDGTPAVFEAATSDNLDRGATFDLIRALARTHDDPGGVRLIVLDYGLQRLLRKSAAARGVPEDELEALFQFPHGPTSHHGLVRHKPAHRDHMHVRFGCPDGDPLCRDPLIGFAGMEPVIAVPSP